MAQTNLATGFNGVQFDVISRSGAPWLRGYQIGSALEYTRPDVQIAKIFKQHSDEFTDSMTAVVTLPTPGGPQETRIFSLRGCHLLAMFARTPVAKAFRVWVLDVLETLNKAEKEAPALTDAPITPDQQCTLQALVRALVEKGGIYAAIWSRFNNHFRLGSYKQLPQSRMSEAVDYLARFEVEPKALPEAAPEPEQSNVYFHNSPEFIYRELEKKHEQAVERCNELSRWAWVMEREINRLAAPLYREIMRKKLGADVALSNAGVEAMGGPVYMGAERIVGAMEEFVAAVHQAAIFAKAMRGGAQLEGRAHLSLAR